MKEIDHMCISVIIVAVLAVIGSFLTVGNTSSGLAVFAFLLLVLYSILNLKKAIDQKRKWN